MRKSAVLVLMLFTAAASAAPADDEAAIREIVDAQATAWNAGDGKAFSARVSRDVAFTNLFGMVLYGSDAFEKRHSAILATFYKGSKKVMAIHKLRFLTPDVAIVDIDNEVRGVKAMPAGIALPADGVVKTQLLEVFVRRDGGWWVEAYHNVDVKESAPAQK